MSFYVYQHVISLSNIHSTLVGTRTIAAELSLAMKNEQGLSQYARLGAGPTGLKMHKYFKRVVA